ncbi:MAG: ureidoglycolate lyase [Polyangiaceae bacterium]
MSSARTVLAVRVTRAAFQRWGDVVTSGEGEGAPCNQGSARRYDWAARLESTRPGARPNLAVFRSEARQLPIEVALLERHPASSQTFLPMRCRRLLVCVAPPLGDGAPDVEGLEAFLFEEGEGVSYLPGVWHHPIVALDASADLAMLAWEDGTARDCVEHPLAAAVRVVG